MKAVRIHGFGGPEVLQLEEAPRPEPGPGEVLVRVHAAGVNPMDWKVRAGLFQRIPYRLPLILGWDVSGTVEGVGPEVQGVAVGWEVHARTDITRDGAYAEYVLVAARDLVARPTLLDHVQAAALPIAGLTAWQALIEGNGMNLREGQTVVILGGAGGVGTLAVQLARWRGARVIATGSAK